MDDQKKTILIVDDSPENISVLGEILKPYYRRQVATNGENALKLIEKGPHPDLILLDIMMPGIGGYETCKRLKADKKTKNIPVMFVTAKAEDLDEAKGFAVGAVDYITKPIKPVRLLARIKTHLKLENALLQLKEQNEELFAAQRIRKDIEAISRHDMKNPLTVVLGNPELLLLDPENLTKKQITQIMAIRTSGYRILEMLNRSLDLIKMESGTYRFNPARVDVLKIINAICNDLDKKFKTSLVDLKISCAKELEDHSGRVDISGDELLTYTLLANLIRNALEASPQGTLVAVDINKQENDIVISIHNQGVIPMEIRDRFFNKYVTSGKNRGTGLGTYSARLFARTQKGDITYTSSEGHGTLLDVVLKAFDPLRQAYKN